MPNRLISSIIIILLSLLKEVFQRCQLNEISINDFINLLEGCMVDSTMDNTNNIDNNNYNR